MHKGMKKRLAVAAAAIVLAGSAAAQDSVQLMGTMDAYVGRMRMAGDPAAKSVVGSGGMTTSWWGLKGTEDLGGGLKAGFALTSFVNVDTGVPGRFTGDTFFSRDANVFLSGDSWGKLTVGRALAPNFLPTILFNPFGDSFTFSPLVLHNNVPLFNGTHWGASTPSDTGWSNELMYSTPNFGGLSANLNYQFGEQPNSNGPHNVGFNVLYFHGPFAATAFYERDMLTNPMPVLFADGNVRKDWMLGASYDLKAVKFYGTYGRATNTADALPAERMYSVGASVPLGAGALLAGYADSKFDTSQRRKTASVGYDYNFSKLTDVYAMLMQDRISGADSGTSFGVGIRKRF
jgi:predicted porin